jgi:SAM-dependent methyltransferase
MGVTVDIAHSPALAAMHPEIVWHEVECCGFREDLPLWLELADRYAPDAPWFRSPEVDGRLVLDVGAGTGRVASPLAAAQHLVIAVDIDVRLIIGLNDNRERATEPGVVLPARGDARELGESLPGVLPPGWRVGLCIVPMQTLQLLGGPAERARFLSGLRPFMAEGGVLACSIVERIEPFDALRGDAAPAADVAIVGDQRYESQPIVARQEGERIVLERVRTITSDSDPAAPARSREHNRIVLDVLDGSRLDDELIEAGWHPGGVRELPDTAEHVGSTIVMARA